MYTIKAWYFLPSISENLLYLKKSNLVKANLTALLCAMLLEWYILKFDHLKYNKLRGKLDIKNDLQV